MVNHVTLVGRVGKDPEVRNLDDSTKVVKFTLATSETYKDKSGQKVENTEWHNITAWNKLAGVIEQYVKKGDLLYIEGKIKTRSWDDDAGNKKYMTEIVCNNLVMLGGKRNEQNQTAPAGNDSFKGDNDFDRMMNEEPAF